MRVYTLSEPPAYKNVTMTPIVYAFKSQLQFYFFLTIQVCARINKHILVEQGKPNVRQ